jgi:hypothetical protein
LKESSTKKNGVKMGKKKWDESYTRVRRGKMYGSIGQENEV